MLNILKTVFAFSLRAMFRIRFVSLNQRIAWELLSWLCFSGLLLLGWQVYDLFEDIPAYPDVLEVLWGIEWYHKTLIVSHRSPFSAHLIFHPLKWHTINLGFNPFLFIFSLPFYEIGGLAFAYNALTLTALLISFAGAIRFMRIYIPGALAIVPALIFTFAVPYWFHVGRHPNILWASSLLPWLAWALERAKRLDDKRFTLLAGLLWGIMINFSLYYVFTGIFALVIWADRFFHLKWIKRGIGLSIIALLLSFPTIIPYLLGTQQDNAHFYGIEHNLHWGASINSLFIPSIYHPFTFVRQFSRSFYRGPQDESGVANLGLVTCFLTLIGLGIALKHKQHFMSPLYLALTGIILSLGLLLKWDGEVIKIAAFRPLVAIIWRLGYMLKPEIFRSPHPISPFEAGIPLPGFIFIAVIPFWEFGRTVSRYIILGLLGAATLSGIALRRFPRAFRYLVITIWLMEALPHPIESTPLPFKLHPAYEWLTNQDLESSEGIVDIAYPTLIMGPEILWAAWLHKKPTASGTGSSWPEHSYELWAYFINEDLSKSEVGLVLYQYRIRYLFLHMYGEKERKMWEVISNNPAFKPFQCFDPLDSPSPWPYPICIAEVKTPEGPINFIKQEGWSTEENWGIWSEGTVSKGKWIALGRQDHVLRLKAFPFCVPGKSQEAVIKVNGQTITTHRWKNCELWEEELPIPSSFVKPGFNELSFEYKYAISPSELSGGKNPDHRKLAVGFIELKILISNGVD